MTLHVSVPVLSLNIWDTCDVHNVPARVSYLVLAYGEQANTISCLSITVFPIELVDARGGSRGGGLAGGVNLEQGGLLFCSHDTTAT